MTEPELSTEDRKLVTLARATRARVGSAEGAAIRDGDGRTYAAVVLGESGDVAGQDLAAVRDLGGPEVVVHAGDARGTIVSTTRT